MSDWSESDEEDREPAKPGPTSAEQWPDTVRVVTFYEGGVTLVYVRFGAGWEDMRIGTVRSRWVRGFDCFYAEPSANITGHPDLPHATKEAGISSLVRWWEASEKRSNY